MTLIESPSADIAQNVRCHIDWQYYLDRREQTLLEAESLPPYLLLPEVEQLLNVTKNDVHHFLINTLFHTGGRISEVLALTQGRFLIGDRPNPLIALPTIKRRGRPSKTQANKPKTRIIPVMDGAYIDEALRYFSTHSKGVNELLFPITRLTADRWVKAAVKSLVASGRELGIPVSCHTFRHSFAVNALLHWIDSKTVQRWLGHSDPRSTEIYLQILNQDTAHLMARVSFDSGLIKKNSL